MLVGMTWLVFKMKVQTPKTSHFCGILSFSLTCTNQIIKIKNDLLCRLL